MNIGASEKPAEATAGIELSPKMRQLLKDPIVPTLLHMAWPNILIMLSQASTGLIETFWVARLGTDALAGMALVFPIVMMVQMMANGAMGGGISSAIARALGAGRRGEADAFVLHAMVINVMLGLGISFVMLALGRSVYRALGGAGGELEAALIYSNVVFGGNVLLWLMSGLAAVIRGTGNMIVPAAVICAGVIFLVPVSPLLIFGFGPIPALGIAGGASLVLHCWFCRSGLVYPVWPKSGAVSLVQAALATVPRHSSRGSDLRHPIDTDKFQRLRSQRPSLPELMMSMPSWASAPEYVSNIL